MQTCRIYIFQVLRHEHGEDRQFFAYHEEGDETLAFPIVWAHFLDEVADAIQYRLDRGWKVQPVFALPGKEECEVRLTHPQTEGMRTMLSGYDELLPEECLAV